VHWSGQVMYSPYSCVLPWMPLPTPSTVLYLLQCHSVFCLPICEPVHLSVYPGCFSTLSLNVTVGCIFTKLSALVHFGKSALFGRVNTVLISGLNFTNFQHWYILTFFGEKGQMRPCLGSKGQRSGSQHDQGPSGWRYMELDAACWVLISSFFYHT